MKRISLLVAFLAPFAAQGQFQQFNSGINVEIKGYVINLSDQVLIFQPAEDNSNFWQALDNRSFALGNLQSDNLIEQAASLIGDTAVVSVRVNEDSAIANKVLIKYFYAKINLVFLLLDDVTKPQFYKGPRYSLFFRRRAFDLEGFFVSNRIVSIIPADKRQLEQLRRFYLDNGYSMPDFLLR